MRAKSSSSRSKTRGPPPRVSKIIAVVDITSSPEPEAALTGAPPIPVAPRPRPWRPNPRSAPPDESTGTSSSNSSTPEGRPNARSGNVKGKGRAQPVTVIELTDSSDDDGGGGEEEEVEERVVVPRRVTRSSSRQPQQPPAPLPTPSKGKAKSEPTVQAKGKAKAGAQHALSPVTENRQGPSPTLVDDEEEEEEGSDASDQGDHPYQLLFLDGSSDVEDVPPPPGSSTMTYKTPAPAGIARTPSIEETVIQGAASSSRRPVVSEVDQPPIMVLPVALAVGPPPREALGAHGQAGPSTQPAQGHTDTGGPANMDGKGIKAGSRGVNTGVFDVSDDDVDYGAYLDVLQGNFMEVDEDEGGVRPFGGGEWLLGGPALEAPVQPPVWELQEGGDEAVARNEGRQLEGVQVPEHLALDGQGEVEEKEDPLLGATRSILEMIPDIDYDFLCALVAEHLPTYGTSQVVEFVINYLFGEGSGYPRAAKGSKREGKRKVGEGDVEEAQAGGDARKKARVSLEGDGEGKGKARDREGVDRGEGETGVERNRQDGGQDHRAEDQEDLPDPNNYLTPDPTHVVPPGRDYQPLSLEALQQEFGQALGKHRAAITAEGGYARAWLALWNEHGDSKDGLSPIALANKGGASHNRKTKAKGKGKQRVLFDEAFERESAFVNGLRASLERKKSARSQREGQERMEGPAAAAGLDGDAVMALDLESATTGTKPDGTEGEVEVEVECQCCFGGYPFVGMAQCPEGHLFCEECFRRNVEGLVGSQNPVIRCMSSDGDGCPLQFAESEMKRMLENKLFMLYEKVKQQKELKEAQIEGLEECPFCDWACVMEVGKDVDKLFRCDGCGEVSCRECKKKEHLPKSCQEMEEDKHLDKRILIEEAMTKALMRNCPKCKKAFLKESGCNKMTCPECHTLSCYVCKKAINGYDHFHQNNPGIAGGSSSNNKCPLWDSVDHRHDDEVNKAYKAAVEQVQKEHPEIDMGKDIKVDLPTPPPPQPQYPAGYVHAGMFGGGPVYAPIPALPHNINPAVARGQLQQAQQRINDLRARLAREEARFPSVTSREDMTRGRVHHFKAQLAAIPRSEASRRVLLGGEIETMTKKLKRAAVERAALTQRTNALREMVREAEAQVPHIRADLAERERRAAEWNREQNELRGRERDRRVEQGERERVAAALAARVLEEQREQQARRREEAMDRVRRQLVLDVEAMREHTGGRFG